ncbi:MAG: transglycosylase domain-containing protein [Christensenellaceae bacterium]|nr:transglycosylase domain-containing protein [Christensenellaceae bacterium]
MITYHTITKDTKFDANMFGRHLVTTSLFDKSNKPIENLNDYLEYTDYDMLSPNVITAFVAIEDKRFFEHSGIDYVGIARAILHNLKALSMKEGASTISQQLAKNTLLSNEKTLNRKLKEIKLAKLIEQNFSKEEILTMYLNVIYFGDGIYGITKASSTFFNKRPFDLTIAESSMLAGIIKNPAKYSPQSDVTLANERKNTILKVLLNNDLISKKNYEEAIEFLNIEKITNRFIPNQSYIKAVLDEACLLLNKSEREILAGGYNIKTYLDRGLQHHIESLMNSDNSNAHNAMKSAIITSNEQSSVVSYHSDIQHSIFKFRRNPASILKPIIVYAPGIERGIISPDTPVIDEPTTIKEYSPRNYNGYYLGLTSIREAVKTSSNVIAVKLLEQLGVKLCKDYASSLGISFDNDNGLSLALGAMRKGCTLLEIVESYMTIANYGMHSAPKFIKSISDENDNLIYTNKISPKNVLSMGTCYLLTDMLRDVAKKGTAKKLADVDLDIASKTGTHGDNFGNSDAWNIAYTPTNTVCVWYGSKSMDKNKMDCKLTGGTYPTLLVKKICRKLEQNKYFKIPTDVIEAEFDQFSSEMEMKICKPSYYTPDVYIKKGLFIDKYAPTEVSQYFDSALPKNFTASTDESAIKIKFRANKAFKYKLIRKFKDEVATLCEYNNEEFCQFEDYLNKIGIVNYCIEVYDNNDIYITRTPNIFLFFY